MGWRRGCDIEYFSVVLENNVLYVQSHQRDLRLLDVLE